MGREALVQARAAAAAVLAAAADVPLTADLTSARAYWLDADVLATPVAPAGPSGAKRSFLLHASASAELRAVPGGVAGADRHPLALQPDPRGLPPAVRERFPHLAGLTCLRLPELPPGSSAAELLTCQLALCAAEAGAGGAAEVDITGVQVAGALDALFEYRGPLGAELPAAGGGGGVTLRVWAPTAQRVRALLWRDAAAEEPSDVVEMTRGAGGAAGVWAAAGPAAWVGRYYVYEVTAFSPTTCAVETMRATDPYSRSLSANGARTQICDLDAPELQPPGWAALGASKPPLAHPVDATIYELHVRDFSSTDPSVPDELRGTFRAFTLPGTHGGRHLRSLAAAGLTHVHLLPTYDFGSVDERRREWRWPAGDLAAMPPDGPDQQLAVAAVADCDAYNWGYDPVHWGVPDGSYSTNPDGATRVREYREMVAALNGAGLRVVADVVYNHTFASGPHTPYSVLDKIVPGYYHRRNADGDIEASTCMNNTACEHAMVARLIVDDLLHWARDFKVDGFRFDLMGHLMKRTVLAARAALDALTVAADGVDGRAIYMYGEGWDYAEVFDGRVGENASQRRLAGTGIGTFNDRIREAAVGANPFADPRRQGLLTGLYTAPNGEVEQGTAEEQCAHLAALTERVLAGVAGNLAGFTFPGAAGALIAGRDAGGVGSNCGYAEQPSDTVNYVSAHDNETLFDMVVLKARRGTPMADLVAMNCAATALVALSQGVPFFHAGDELLRSKSLDRDSYNSGDWFNALDWTGARNNFGVGLPPASKNATSWHFMRPLLADAALRPEPRHIAAAAEHFRAVLAVRRSARLLRLRSAEEVAARLVVLGRGAAGQPGVLVWALRDGDGGAGGGDALPRIDARFRRIVVAVNATGEEAVVVDSALAAELAGGGAVAVHEELAGQPGAGAVWDGGALRVPRLAVTVLVQRHQEEGNTRAR